MTRYFFSIGRGALDGFTQGLFANTSETISKECLGEQTYKHLNDFVTMIVSGDIVQIFRSFGVFYQFTFSVQKSCRSNEIGFEVVGFCLNKTNNCSVTTLIDNLTKSIFKLTGTANQIIEIIVNQYNNFSKTDFAKSEEIENTYRELFRSIGSMLRSILGFTNTHSSGGRPIPAPRPNLATQSASFLEEILRA